VPTDTPYSISDLAGLTGLSVRTIRYYLAQGLIPAAGESGPGAHYGEGHLARLRLVRRLQQQHLPLAEIRARLASLTDADVAALADAAVAPPEQPRTSALDYVRSILSGPSGAAPVGMQPAPVPPPVAAPAPSRRPVAASRMLRWAEPAPARVAEAKVLWADAEPTDEPATQPIERSQWERLSLGPNLELHIRRPLGRLEQKRVERLITIARQVLKEEQP
jgi:DNA-binding transcriptional MerR regulator